MSKKATEATEATEVTEVTAPATTTGMNASRMGEMQKKLEAMKDEMAAVTAEEIVKVLHNTVKNAEHSTAEELPTPVSNYLTAKLASACFMALRDELTSAYMRCEAVQADKAIIHERFAQNSFRSDVEKAAAERSLTYYESLDERLDEVMNLIADVVHVHQLAAQAMYDEDEARQQDVPENERTYVQVPGLRWISNADKAAHPDDYEQKNDFSRIKEQAKFWLSYNMS